MGLKNNMSYTHKCRTGGQPILVYKF